MNYPNPSKAARNEAFLAMMQEEGWLPEPEPYPEAKILKNKRFLIVCKGENTEKEYFEKFEVVGNAVIEVKGGFAGGKKYLVKEAKKLVAQDRYKEHEVWCVFDFDVKFDNPKQKQDFDNAIKMGEENNFKIAFSNDAFELWFVLHYKLISGQHHRTEYFDMLTDIWKLEHSYESMGKESDFCKNHYKRLKESQKTAVKNAKKLYAKVKDDRAPHKMNPCTTVYQLVQELNKYIRR